MRKFKLILIGIGIVCTAQLSAQDASDFVGSTLQLSMTQPGGSARILGLGGTQTALGGDISSVSSNPAGLGFFNRSEFSGSLSFNYINSESDYLGSSASDARLNMNFGNLGAVINSKRSGGNFNSASFGFSINRIADFQNQITYEGNSFNQVDGDDNIIFDQNRPADFIEYATLSSFVDNAGNIGFDNDFAELAYETFLTEIFDDGSGNLFVDRDIYAVDANGNYLTDNEGNDIPAYSEPQFPVFQTETIDSRGAAYQISAAYGVNYQDRLYLGGNIGILTMTQEVEREYTEVPTSTDLNNIVLQDNYEQNGIGVNATLGIIGRPFNSLLVGVSYTTPSVYGIEQIRSITLTANYLNGTESFGFEYDPFNYTVFTPSKLRLGATYFLGKIGFITSDFERVNYTGARLANSDDNVSFSVDNSIIDQSESVWNYRVGAEFRYEKFRFRGGYSYMADPIDNGFDQSESRISLGGGIRTKEYFADMAVILSDGRNSLVSPYPGQQAQVETQNTMLSLTFGIFF